MARNKSKKQNNKPKTWIIGAAIIAFLVLVVGLLISNSGKKDPEIFSRAINKLADTQTLNTKAQLTINLPEKLRNRQRPLTTINVQITGDVKRNDDSPELAGNLNLEARGPGNAFYTNGDLRIFNDSTAFNLEEFPVLLSGDKNLTKKWIYINTPLLNTNKDIDLESALATIVPSLSYQKEGSEDGLLHFTGALNKETEQQLMEVFKLSSSNNQGLHVLARLLAANHVDALDIWIDKETKELRKVNAHFVRTLKNGDFFDFATLKIELQDYGKPVEIDIPEKKVTVKPGTFKSLFGSGEIKKIETEESQ